MHNPWSIRRENGAALVISLLMVAVLLIVGSGALTNSRIETQMASNDKKVKEALLAAEYAMALGESMVEQATSESDNDIGSLADRLTSLSARLYDMREQKPWDQLVWDDRDSMDVTVFFADAAGLPANLPPVPPIFLTDDQPRVLDPHKVPRLIIESKYRDYDSLVLPHKAWTTYVNVSAHGAWAKWTALGNGLPDDKPGKDYPTITYNDRYPGTRVVIQSIYAKRY